MSVNSYKILKPHISGSTAIHINVPISQTPWLTGQEDIIKSMFVDVEVENSITPTINYEKVKFSPKNPLNTNVITNVIYSMFFLEGGSYNPNSYWGSIGFTSSDFKFKKNSFTKSFLRLDFYDSDITSSQRLLFFITIFPRFSINDYNEDGTPPLPSEYDLKFTLGNTLKDRDANGEGFNLYHFKDEVLPTVDKEIFMRASFSNAKTGIVTRFMSNDDPNINVEDLMKTTNGTNLVNKLHTKYILKRNQLGHNYSISENYSNNIGFGQNNYRVALYEISTS
tara:strand:+ start:64035 stop:64877 length:843 start_codon:yes stop_codon:yes gene_type:complete